MADPAIDPYKLAERFVFYPRWTSSHFAFHRDLIRIMCVDAGDELKAAWGAIKDHGGPAKQPEAMRLMQQPPHARLFNRATGKEDVVEVTWRNAPDVVKRYEKIEYTRRWTIFYRDAYREALRAVNAKPSS